MIGLTAGLEIARKALSSYQLALSIYGNNIANVNTPGFSRKRPVFGEAEAVDLPLGRIGLGVNARTIERMRDVYLDRAYRRENTAYARYETLEERLSEIEMAFSEPSETGLGDVLRDFWDAWQELANQPESAASRSYVVSKATSLSTTLSHMSSQLTRLRENIDTEVQGIVGDVNSLAQRIAHLNGQIVEAEVSGNEASDLRDKRDLLIDELSGLVDIQVFETNDGSASVKIGSEALVERTTAVPLDTSTRGDNNVVVTDVTHGAGARVIHVSGGRLGGLLETRDETVPGYLARLDEIAATVVREVNRIHRTGFDSAGVAGGDFFDPDFTSAATIKVADAVRADTSLIAASADGSAGNGAVALAVADLRLAGIFGVEGATSEDYYASLIADLGIEAERAVDNKDAEDLLLTEIETRRESVKGVSIDEEMTNLVASQHAYQAAVKLVTVIDDLMETIMTTL
jgi:flagellar hook-associated protein 1 FlgK